MTDIENALNLTASLNESVDALVILYLLGDILDGFNSADINDTLDFSQVINNSHRWTSVKLYTSCFQTFLEIGSGLIDRVTFGEVWYVL